MRWLIVASLQLLLLAPGLALALTGDELEAAWLLSADQQAQLLPGWRDGLFGEVNYQLNAGGARQSGYAAAFEIAVGGPLYLSIVAYSAAGEAQVLRSSIYIPEPQRIVLDAHPPIGAAPVAFRLLAWSRKPDLGNLSSLPALPDQALPLRGVLSQHWILSPQVGRSSPAPDWLSFERLPGEPFRQPQLRPGAAAGPELAARPLSSGTARCFECSLAVAPARLGMSPWGSLPVWRLGFADELRLYAAGGSGLSLFQTYLEVSARAESPGGVIEPRLEVDGWLAPADDWTVLRSDSGELWRINLSQYFMSSVETLRLSVAGASTSAWLVDNVSVWTGDASLDDWQQ